MDNAIQLLITGLCAGIAAYKGLKSGRREWVFLSLFLGIYFMGDLYWQLYLVFYHQTPVYSSIPYAAWYASYIFLLFLLAELEGGSIRDYIRKFWPVFIFTVGMCVFFMRFGDYISNILCTLLMSLLLCRSFGGFLEKGTDRFAKTGKAICLLVFIFCMLEYGMWMSSCFWTGDTIRNPYFWFDFLLSLDMLLLTFATGKAVTNGLY